MNLQDITYLFPEAFYLLSISLLLILLFLFLHRYRQTQLNKYASPTVLKRLLVPRPTAIYWGKAWGIVLVWICGVLAWMQPVGIGYYPEEVARSSGPRAPLHEVIFLIDASTSMNVTDINNGQSRLAFAKDLADELIRRLQGEMIALHTFTSEVFQESPLTTDYFFVRLMLRQIAVNQGGSGGTNLIEAMEEMKRLYFPTSQSPILKTLLIFSDGGDTAIEAAQGEEKQGLIRKLMQNLNDAESNHLRVLTIGIGSQKGQKVPGIQFEGKPVLSALNEPLLKQISQQGNGHFYLADSSLAPTLAREIIDSLTNRESNTQTNQSASMQNNLIHDLYYQIPLGIAILLLTVLLGLPDTHKSD